MLANASIRMDTQCSISSSSTPAQVEQRQREERVSRTGSPIENDRVLGGTGPRVGSVSVSVPQYDDNGDGGRQGRWGPSANPFDASFETK